MKAEDCIT